MILHRSCMRGAENSTRSEIGSLVWEGSGEACFRAAARELERDQTKRRRFARMLHSFPSFPSTCGHGHDNAMAPDARSSPVRLQVDFKFPSVSSFDPRALELISFCYAWWHPPKPVSQNYSRRLGRKRIFWWHE